VRDRDRDQKSYETETKNYETKTETSPVKSSQLQHRSVFYFFYYTHEVNDEPEMDFAFKMITK